MPRLTLLALLLLTGCWGGEFSSAEFQDDPAVADSTVDGAPRRPSLTTGKSLESSGGAGGSGRGAAGDTDSSSDGGSDASGGSGGAGGFSESSTDGTGGSGDSGGHAGAGGSTTSTDGATGGSDASGGATSSSGGTTNVVGGAAGTESTGSESTSTAGTAASACDSPRTPENNTAPNGSSGEFESAAYPVCYRVDFATGEFSGWGCSNAADRWAKVNGTAVTCGDMPLPGAIDGAYYFEFGPGAYAKAGFYWFNWL